MLSGSTQRKFFDALSVPVDRAGRLRAGRLRGWSIGVWLSCLALLGCAERKVQSALHTGPVVLITIDTLRADVVGGLAGGAGSPSLTPNLDRLIAEADWASSAIAASSWTVPSMASIVTGKQPWAHGNVHGDRAILAEEQRTVAEVFQAAGYRTVGFRSNVWLRPRFGYAQGFDAYHSLGGRKRAVAVLSSLGATADTPAESAASAQTAGGSASRQPEFVWLHVLPPHAPYLRHAQYADRLTDAPTVDQLPERVTAAMLEQYLDPRSELPVDVQQRFWALYRLHVSHADKMVGELLDAIRASGAWDDTLIAITSDHGEEFGEEGQIAHGGNLNRVLVEVPMIIKLPASLKPDRNPASRTLQQNRAGVSNVRLFATLTEAIGQAPGEGVLPSLWSGPERAGEPDTVGALSELYLGNGDNRFSLTEPDQGGQLQQIHWVSRFAEPEDEYYLARRIKGDQALPSGEQAAQLWQRQGRAFDTSLPLRGAMGKPEVTVRSWSTARIEPATTEQARRLERTWQRWNGQEDPPIIRFGGASDTEFSDEERERLEKLGYVVASVARRGR